MKSNSASAVSELRNQAEIKLSKRKKKKAAATSATAADIQRLVHELEVHQIELEMQNEQLLQVREELEDALHQYTDLYDFAPVGYFTLAPDGTIRKVNLAGADLLSIPRSRLTKRRFGLFVNPEYRPAFNAFLEKVFISGEKETCEIKLLKDKTESLWAHIEAATETGQHETCRVVIVDITMRKRAEKAVQKAYEELEVLVQERTADLANANRNLQIELAARKQVESVLKESEWRHKIITELTTDYTFIVDVNPNGILKLRWASENMFRQTGRTVEDAKTSDMWGEIIHPADLTRFSNSIKKILSTAEADTIECRAFMKQGEMRWIRIFARPQVDEGNHVTTIVGAIQDITERKFAEEELQKSEWRNKIVSELISDYIFVVDVDPNGGIKFRWTSENAFNVTGKMVENAAMAHDWKSLIHPDDEEGFLNFMDRILSTDMTGELEFRALPNQGKERWVRVFAQQEADGSDDIKTIVGAVQDITERKIAEERLQKSEHKLSLFVQYSPAAIAMLDRDMKYIAASRRYFVDYRLADQNIVGRSHYEIFPEIPERWKEIHRRCLAGAIEKAEEDPFPRADGTLDWIRWEIHPWHEKSGEIGGIILFSEVITERKHAEQALKESNDKFQNLAANIPGNVSYVNANTLQYEFINDLYEKSFGKPREQIIGRHIREFIGEANYEFALKYIEEARSGKSTSYESTFNLASGKRWIEVNYAPFFDASGQVASIVVLSYDITEHKRLEEALQLAEADYRTIFENAPVGIFRSTTEGRFIKVNHAMAEMYGYESPEEMVADVSSIAEQIYTDSTLRTKLAHQLNEYGEFLGFESLDRRKDGGVFWTSMNVRVAKNESGEILYYEGFVIDITKSKVAEDALQKSRDRYQSLFNNMEEGIAINEIVFNEHGNAIDYIILDVNPAFAKQSPYTIEEAVGSRATILYKMSPEFISDWWSRHSQLKQPVQIEFYHQPIDRWFDIVTTPSENGRFSTLFTDITQRKQAEALLEKNRAMLAETERMGNVGGWEFNIDTKEQIWTEEVYRIHEVDFTYKPTVDKGINFYTPASRPIIEQAVQRTVEHGESFDLELEIITAKGNPRWIHTIGEADLEHRRVFGFFQDITERKRAEMERYALLEIMKGLTLTSSLPDFFKLIHQSIAKVIAAKNFFIVLHDKQTGLFEEVYASDEHDAPMPPSKLEKSFTSYVFRTGTSILLNPQSLDDLLKSNEVKLIGTKPACWMGAPLKTPSEIIGVIAVQDYENPNCYSDRDKNFLASIGAQIALGVERKQAQEDLLIAKESLRLANLGLQQALTREQRVSRTDSLTEVHNRRYFFEMATHEFITAKRYKKPLSMIMFDIDHFKQFNDTHGHQAGDEILKYVAQIATRQLRDADILARYGGEEFVILLPNSTAEESAVVAERIRENVADYKMDLNGRDVSVTISAGVAEYIASTDKLDHLVQHADQAMYTAKGAGRNCVIVHSE